MNIIYEDFIGIYENVYPDGYCKHLINEFERCREEGAGANRIQREGVRRDIKDDISIFLTSDLKVNFRPILLNDFEGEDTRKLYISNLQKCYDDYVSKYSILQNENLVTNDMKAQKTGPGGGYHVFHYEAGDTQSNRALVFILYLNTLNENDGGETEFLYQRKRIRPKENTVIIFPGGFTHTHRGNPVLGDVNKYIITGWFIYQ